MTASNEPGSAAPKSARAVGDLDVSVIVPVYNPGKFLEDCIDGIRAQTMDPTRFEVVFVDDGSTDDTPARLDELVLELPNVRVFHEPGSGWSGRPRNVGTDKSYGRYVFYCDHDDWLSPEALERMVAYADANASDVLLPKMVGHNRGVPSLLYSSNRPDATVWTAALMTSLTPHKLFRRAFLDEIGLRFPEGRRRLEDHVFVTEAYLRAKRISVLSEYPCYHHISREDAANAGFERVDPVGYYGNVREVLDIIDRYTEAGPKRDAVRARSFTHEIIGRLKRTASSRGVPGAYRRELFAEARKLLVERYEPTYDARFPLAMRQRAKAVRLNRPAELNEINEKAKKVAVDARITGVEAQGTRWVVTIHAEPTIDGTPIVFTPRRAGRWSVDPRILPASRAARISVKKKEIVGGKVWMVVTERTSDLEWVFAANVTATLKPLDDGVPAGPHRIVLDGTAGFDPTTLACGGQLTTGLWDITFRWGTCGFDMRSKLVGDPALPMPAPISLGAEPSVAIAYLTDNKNTFAIDINQRKTTLVEAACRRGLGPVSRDGTSWAIRMPVDIAPDANSRKVQVVLMAPGRKAGEVTGSLTSVDGSAQLVFRDQAKIARRYVVRRKFALGLRPKATSAPIPIGTARVDGHGTIVAVELNPRIAQR
jgi:glycosyltransferase involved in cell wall biosynthesis